MESHVSLYMAICIPYDDGMSAKTSPSDDEPLTGAAPENELVRLDQCYRDLEDARHAVHLKRITVQAPPTEPGLRAGDQP